MERLRSWLLKHSADGGKYVNVPSDRGIKCRGIKCVLCGADIKSGSEIVNYTGKSVCRSCAKSIAQKMVSRISTDKED